MTSSLLLDDARTAFRQHRWADAATHFAAAGREAPLPAADLESFAAAAFLSGRDAECIDAWSRAHQQHMEAHEVPAALRCAFWLAFVFFNRGEPAQGGGWQARAQELLDESGIDCVERGYLLVHRGIEFLACGDLPSALTTFGDVRAIAVRFADRDLRALGSMGRGRVLTMLGHRTEGLALLDEAMVAVINAEVSPIVIGQIYCGAIETCHDLFDLGRAAEWTRALDAWVEAQPDLVAYRGECRLYRADILRMHGEWPQAMEEAAQACERLSNPPGQAGLATAHYQRADLHRLRGEFDAAEAAYREAARLGKQPEPGLALLRVAQGQAGVAAAIMRRALDETHDAVARCHLLPPYIDVMLAARDPQSARAALAELIDSAASFDAPYLNSAAARAEGAVLLAEGKPADALPYLRRACAIWQELPAPYEAACTRLLIARCCAALGDHASAELERDGARWSFERLGAAHGAALDLERLGAESDAEAAGGLTARELEVLRLIAAGRTNRAIAAELIISEKTVARHISNIFAKLGVSSRSAATAYAYEHELV